MINYDPAVIQEFAEKMYKRANSIIVSATILGVLFGGGIGYFLDQSLGYGQIVPIIGLILGGIIGFSIGQDRAFALKLNAQTALCQMKTEQNTRRVESKVNK